MSKSALKHIEHLSLTIGPRGSTTTKEKEGHAYAAKVLSGLGFQTGTETFSSATSTYTPFILGLGTVLVAEVLFYFIAGTENAAVGALAAFVISAVAFTSLILELLGTENPLRWFVPNAPSQNVVGVVPAQGQAKRRVAVVAHVDSHRTPLFWRTPATFAVYRIITTLGVLSLAALCVMFVIGVFAPGAALRTYSLIPAALVALAWLMVLQAHFTPFTAGANDNASGVGVLLAVAEQLKKKRLRTTEVWLAATGCEEVGAYGSRDFFRRHAAEFDEGLVIVVDNIAGAGTGPVYLDAEGILTPMKYPATVLDLAAQIAAARPKLGARPHTQQGAYTDGLYALKAGLDCLTLVGYQKDGWIPNWHNKSDVFANVDATAVDSAEQFVLEVLKRLDGTGGETASPAPARSRRPARKAPARKRK